MWCRYARGERFLILPDGQTDLLFRHSAAGWRGFVVGPMPVALVTEEVEGSLVGLRLEAGAARAIVGLGLDRVAGHLVPLGALGLDALLDAASLDRACADRDGLLRWGQAFGHRVARRAPVDLCAREAARQLLGGEGSVRAIARALGVHERTLRRRVRQEVGLAPKRLAGLGRLHRALAARSQGASWARAAVAAGYADQSHLAREVRALTGFAPAALALALSDSFKPGHVPAPTLRPR